VRRTSRTGLIACVLLLGLTLSACEKAPLRGRYYRSGQWIEFRPDGFVVDGFSGDAIRYRVEGRKLVLWDSAGSIEGEIVDSATVRIGKGNGPMGESFAGTWVMRAASGNVLAGSEAQGAAGPIVGQWRAAADETRLEFKADGTYSMTPRITGSYQMLQGQRVRMTLVEDGRKIGEVDQDYVIEAEGTVLKLTMPDGSTTSYQRVQ
jgi:hypothetical protein